VGQGSKTNGMISALQLTTSSTHAKPTSVYMKLFDSLSLADDEKIQIFVVCPEQHAEGYAKSIHSKMISNFNPSSSPASLLKEHGVGSGSDDDDWNLQSLISVYRNLEEDKRKLKSALKSGNNNADDSDDGDTKKNEIASTILLHKIEFNVLKFKLSQGIVKENNDEDNNI
jgi:hypothetical protein